MGVSVHNIYRYGNIESGRELTDIKEMHFVELPKFKKDKPRQLMTKFEKWLYVLKYGEQYKDDPASLPETLKDEEEIVMAVERMHEASNDAEVKELMEMRQKSLHDEATRLYHAEKRATERGLAKGIEQGIENGMEKGMEKKALEIAKNLKQAGIDMAIISENTGLSREAIEKL